MNTQQGKKQKGRLTRLYMFLASIFIVGGVLGGVIVGAVMAHGSGINEEERQALSSSSSAPYGTRDGKALTDEGALVLESSDFVPLECGLPEEIQEYTYYLCEAYYIDFDFVMALMYSESSFRADIVSDTSDYALMQINAVNHKELSDKLGITDFTDPYQNIRAGLYILRGLFEKYDDAAKVLMAYNMGDYGASVLWEKGICSTTYTNKVLAKADEYAAMRGSSTNEQ